LSFYRASLSRGSVVVAALWSIVVAMYDLACELRAAGRRRADDANVHARRITGQSRIWILNVLVMPCPFRSLDDVQTVAGSRIGTDVRIHAVE
jgi:hypothetical protein